jgi:hypothetical protein
MQIRQSLGYLHLTVILLMSSNMKNLGPVSHFTGKADVFGSVCTVVRRAIPFEDVHMKNHKRHDYC